MIIVIDTTETFTDLRLDGPNFKLLKAYVSRTSSHFFVPSVVFEETVNHFREKLASHVSSASEKVRAIRRITGNESLGTLPSIDLSAELGKFREYLAGRIKELSGKVVGTEKIGVDALVARSLLRRKPFDGEGRRGFRDAVLWETILQEVVKDGGANLSVALISNNSSDFGKEPQLAEDLREDCKVFGQPEGCVRLFNGLQRFVEVEVKPHLETLERIEAELKQGSYKQFEIQSFVSNYFDDIRGQVRDHVRRCNWERLMLRVDGTFHSQDLHSLEKCAARLEVSDVWSLDDNQVAAGLELHFNGEIECSEQSEECWPYEDEVYCDVVEHEFVGDAAFIVFTTAILNKETGEVEDYAVDDVDITLGSRWRNSHRGVK